MLSRLVASSRQSHSLRCAARVFTQNPQTALVNQAYFGIFMTQRQALQANATFSPASSRLFSSNSEDEGLQDFDQDTRRNQGRREYRGPQLQPEEVLETVKTVTLEDLQSMNFAEMSQFINKVNRACYINPKLFTQNQRQITMKFIENLSAVLREKKASEIPMGSLADFSVICARFHLLQNVLGNVFSAKLRELVKENPQALEKNNFTQLAAFTMAYNSSDPTQVVLIKDLTRRIQNLDAEISPNRLCVLVHDLFSRREKNAIKNKEFIKAFGNYLEDSVVFNSLETIQHAKIFKDMTIAAMEYNNKHTLMRKQLEYLHKHMNRLQEQSVIFCLEALNNLSKMERVSLQSKQTETSAKNFTKDLFNLVIEMANANSEMVDTFFLVKFLVKMAECQDLRSYVSEANQAKIMSLFQAKLNEETSKVQIQRYKSNADFYKIASVFGKQIPGFTEFSVNRWLETTYRLNSNNDFVDFKNLKAAVDRDFKDEKRTQMLNQLMDKLKTLYLGGQPLIQKDYYTLFALQNLPNGEKKSEVLDVIKLDNFEALKEKKQYFQANRVLDILRTYCSIDMPSQSLREAIEKLIQECALTPEGALKFKIGDIAELEQVFLCMRLDQQNPLRKALYPAYVNWVQATPEKRLINPINDYNRAAQLLIYEDPSNENKEKVLTNLLEMLSNIDLNKLRSYDQKEIFDFIYDVMRREDLASSHTKKLAQTVLSAMPGLDASQTNNFSTFADLITKAKKMRQTIDLSSSDNMVTNYFKEYIASKSTNFSEMNAENFNQLCQAVAFLKNDSLPVEFKDNLLEYVISDHEEILKKYEEIGYLRQSVDTIIVMDMLVSHYFSTKKEFNQDAPEASVLAEFQKKLRNIFIESAKQSFTEKKYRLAFQKIIQGATSFKNLTKDEISALQSIAHSALEHMSVMEISNLVTQDVKFCDFISPKENRREHKQLSQSKFIWNKIFDALCVPELEKIWAVKWLKLHTLLCMLQLDDPKYQNIFIEQLGDKFDSLNTPQLLQLAQNMVIAGLNQEDILAAITSKFINYPKPDPKALFRLADSMIELNLQNTPTYETVKQKMLESPLPADRFVEVTEKQFFLRNVIARNMQDAPEIKPIFDEFMKSYKPSNIKLSINTDIIDAFNAGLCGEEKKGIYTNLVKRQYDADLPQNLIKNSKLRLENFGYKVLQNHQIGAFRAPLYIPSVNTALLFSQYHSYLFDDRTLSASAALRKSALESDPSKPNVVVVNYKLANATMRFQAEFDRMMEEDWGLKKLETPELAKPEEPKTTN